MPIEHKQYKSRKPKQRRTKASEAKVRSLIEEAFELDHRAAARAVLALNLTPRMYGLRHSGHIIEGANGLSAKHPDTRIMFDIGMGGVWIGSTFVRNAPAPSQGRAICNGVVLTAFGNQDLKGRSK